MTILSGNYKTKLRLLFRSTQEEDFDATTFVDVDAEVVAVQPSPSDTEIVVELLEMEASVMMMIIIPLKLLINHKNALIKMSCCKLLRLCRGSPYF